jgi:hypothetical protein
MDADGAAVSKDEDDIARSEHSSGAPARPACDCTTMYTQAVTFVNLHAPANTM